jgi:NTP pyrophosphatase (non-canonical NTP hydrolase)
MNIEELQYRAYDHAHSKGFWNDYEEVITDTWQSEPAIEAIKSAFIGQKLALIHSEVSEALEEVREGHYDATHKHGEKPEGLPSELADIVIRVADLCGALGVDLEATIIEKLDYNSRSRGHKHGKKF